MEPRIQYAQTKDEVSIAFWTLGKGMPFVSMPSPPFSNIQGEWQDPEHRAWYERLAQKRNLVRYDGRGTGLSQREATDFSIDAQIRDLEAIVDRLGLESFALYAQLYAGPVAIAYAVRNPKRVSHLILGHTFAQSSEFNESPQVQGVMALLEHDWELFTETVAHILSGWSAGEPARRFAAFIRESVTPEALRAAMVAFDKYDVADLLPRVRARTLVLYRRDVSDHAELMGISKGLTSRIPDARLALVEGDAGAPYAGNVDSVIQAIDDFLGLETPSSNVRTPGPISSQLERPLSARQLEVLRLLASGQRNKEIARELSLSVHTVERHVANIYTKIGARGRTHATAYALKQGLL